MKSLKHLLTFLVLASSLSLNGVANTPTPEQKESAAQGGYVIGLGVTSMLFGYFLKMFAEAKKEKRELEDLKCDTLVDEKKEELTNLNISLLGTSLFALYFGYKSWPSIKAHQKK